MIEKLEKRVGMEGRAEVFRTGLINCPFPLRVCIRFAFVLIVTGEPLFDEEHEEWLCWPLTMMSAIQQENQE